MVKVVGVVVDWRLFLVVIAGTIHSGLEVRKPKVVISCFVRLGEAWESLVTAVVGLGRYAYCLRS
jgi:hypothetical protein